MVGSWKGYMISSRNSSSRGVIATEAVVLTGVVGATLVRGNQRGKFISRTYGDQSPDIYPPTPG